MKTLAFQFATIAGLIFCLARQTWDRRARKFLLWLFTAMVAVGMVGCSSPARRLASEVRTTQAKVQKTEERVRVVERTIVDREALPLAKLTLGLLEIARDKIPNPPVSFGMATGAALRTYDRLTRAAGPLDAEDEARVQAGLAAARAADAEPPLPGRPVGTDAPPAPPPDIFTPWDAAATVSNADLKTAKRERAEARSAAMTTMAKAADALYEAAAKDEKMNRWFGLGGVLHYGGQLLRALVIGGGILALGWTALSFAFPVLGLSAIPFRRKPA